MFCIRDFIERDSVKLRKKVVRCGWCCIRRKRSNCFRRRAQLLNNISTYIFLPNEMADTDAVRPGYVALGFNRRVITKLATEMVPRRHYLVKEGEQMRIFELPWGDGVKRSSALMGGLSSRVSGIAGAVWGRMVSAVAERAGVC